MKNKTILIVEDEPPMVMVVGDFLRQDGFHVLVAKNGIDGLALAKEHHPDLILLDILMPKMDGFGMLAELRKDSWGKEADVVILTNYSDDEKKKMASAAGVNDFWLKTDYTLAEILFRVKERLTHNT